MVATVYVKSPVRRAAISTALITLAPHALSRRQLINLTSVKERKWYTHNAPAPNTIVTATLSAFLIWSLQVMTNGISSKTKSIKAFPTAEVKTNAPVSMQCPGVQGFQIFSRGIHSKIRAIMMEKQNKILKTPRPIRGQYNCRVTAKMRKIWTIIADFIAQLATENIASAVFVAFLSQLLSMTHTFYILKYLPSEK